MILRLLFILCLFTFVIKELKKPTSDFINFSNEYTGHDACLEYIKSQIKTSKRVVFYSLFNVWPWSLVSDDKNIFTIQVSGESRNRPTNQFDLNLIMEKTDLEKRIVYFPYFSWRAFNLNLFDSLRKRNYFVPKTKFCLFVVSNHEAPVRNRFFHKLNKQKRVDSCGKYLNNTGFYAPLDPLKYLDFISQYQFMICFENEKKDYYLTEKLLMAYAGNTVPIYYGANQVTEWFDSSSFLILNSKHESEMESLINTTLKLSDNKDEYRKIWNKSLLRNGKLHDDLSINKIIEKVLTVVVKK